MISLILHEIATTDMMMHHSLYSLSPRKLTIKKTSRAAAEASSKPSAFSTYKQEEDEEFAEFFKNLGLFVQDACLPAGCTLFMQFSLVSQSV